MQKDINLIAGFLAKRDLTELTKKQLKKQYGVDQADAMLVFGNDLPYVIGFASRAFLKGIAKVLVICGGIGHSTEHLREAVIKSSQYSFTYEEIKDLSEAEIYGKIAEECYGIPKKQIFLDMESTNCGENAINGLKLLKENGLDRKNFILIQDPILQLRSRASLERHSEGELIISYAPFIPKLKDDLSYDMNVKGVWDFSRFIELLLGEISRLYDDKNGYGPNGRDFITHVDVPKEIMESYSRLRKQYADINTRELG